MKAGNNQIAGNGFHLSQMVSRKKASDTEIYSTEIELDGDVIISVNSRCKAKVTKIDREGGIYQHTVFFPCGCREVKRKRENSSSTWYSKTFRECDNHWVS